MKWRNALGVFLSSKRIFYKTIIRPTMFYETKCWFVKRKHIHKTSVREMKLLKQINENT